MVIGIILFEVIILIILLSNLWILRRLGDYPEPSDWPYVSVLVPARNEALNIEACVRSLLIQQYPNFEVIALDDNSTDNTWQILEALAAEDSRLKILKGAALPADWLGKHWACHQLAQVAAGELLLFTDADTRHHPFALQDSVAALQTEKVDLLAAIPYQEVESWAERLVVPLIPWSIVSFVPLVLAYRLPYSILSVAIGQFMLLRRSAYEQIGGYRAIRQHVVDDLTLGRRIKAQGLCWRLLDAGPRVRCRMYRNFRQVYQGLSKNLFVAFEYKTPFFLFVWLWLGHVFWTPLLMLGLGLAGVQFPLYTLVLASITVIMALLWWGITHRRFGLPPYLTFLYPVTIVLSVIIATNSMLLTLTNRSTWKGRVLVRSSPR